MCLCYEQAHSFLRRYADKFIKVYARDGSETWVLIHVEVQGEPEEAFVERMFTDQYRRRDRYGWPRSRFAQMPAQNRRCRIGSSRHVDFLACRSEATIPTPVILLSGGDAGMPHRVFDRYDVFAIIEHR